MGLDYQLQGRGILLTGGTGGVGTFLTEALLDEGCRIVAGHRSDGDRSRAYRARFSNVLATDRLRLVAADLTTPGGRAAILDEASGGLGDSLAGAVDCSGIPMRGTLADIEAEDFESSWRVNFLGPVLLARDVARRLAAGAGGSMILFTSQHAVNHPTGKEGYSGPKAALSLHCRYLARSFAPSVRCNEICLGALGLGMSAATREQYAESLVDPAQVTHAVLTLLSDRLSGHITGSRVRLERGSTLPFV